MLARGSAPWFEAGDLAPFLAQIEALPVPSADVASPDGDHDSHRGCRTAEAQLRSLGLVGDDPDAAPWNTLNPADWFILLRGMASRRPDLAVTLAALGTRVRSGIGDMDGQGWALHASMTDGWLQLWSPEPPERHSRWRFLIGDDVHVIDSALAQDASLQACGAWLSIFPMHGAESCAPVGQQIRRWRHHNALALVSGLLWRLLDVTRAHAANRPMFGRRLIDFPTVQLRLLRLHLQLLTAEELADAAFADETCEPGAALLELADALRVDAQQICGGSGYMAPSEFAAVLGWLECAEQMLRATWPANAGRPLDACAMRQCARDRLRRAGVPLALHAAQVTRTAGAGAAQVAN
ncbi:acyl-CoA dehydrogenase family protein [Variovorax dokdonensis]|uniref:Acyl-CoA dehydrogenase family protein n=1 Tax=Variovorax dokdonensis TaxID=344883 RepID=A0ABT7NBI3_9BURK|nr:acyl-CoA dehydrogenase family protein [Variovorax dokdonensis]MDM0045304.1 acyl-CoA dehydrogenase family protein [Variovorax dokdonensis]